MNVVIRAMRPGEVDDIVQVHEEAATVAYADIFPGSPFPREDTIRRWQSFPGKVAVADDTGRVVGFVAYDETEIHALYVLPTYQGSGLGSRLLAVADLPSRLWVLRDNLAARAFYEARGWHPTDTERIDYGAVVLLYRRVKPADFTQRMNGRTAGTPRNSSPWQEKSFDS